MNYSGISKPLPKLIGVRPMVLLSGFLGAGKTTFLRKCLNALGDREFLADVILNDRENAELDSETLRNSAASVRPLAGSCVCCEGLDDLAEIALAVSKTKHDVLLIELNGTADPIPLIETFTLLESQFKMQPRWQVCLIDARYFGKRQMFRDLEELQLETASHFCISHLEKISREELAGLYELIEKINPRASETDAEALTGQLAKAIMNNQRYAMTFPDNQRSSLTLSKPEIHDARHHLSHQFTSCQILLPEPLSQSPLVNWLENLPADVVRAKVLVRTLENLEERYLFERVGTQPCSPPLSVPISDRIPASAIFIGAELDPLVLLESAQKHLGETCELS